MKTYGLLAVCLVACLLVGVAEPRRSRGGSSRGSGKPSRGTSRRQPSAPPPAPAPAASGTSLSHTGLASLSYPGYNSAPAKKISVPDTPKAHDTRPVGWNVNKETSIKKDTSSNVQSAPSNNAGSHSYPASGGQSGASGSHAYPASGGLSGANGPPAGGQHNYPASNGGSGTAGQQHSYPASGANSGTGGQQHAYPANGAKPAQPGYPASNGLSGSGTSNQQKTGQAGAPASAVNSYPVNSQNAYPSNNQPYQGNNMGHGAQPPPYSPGHPPAYGGAPGYGAPPAYGSPQGYGVPGYGAPPSYGSHGYGGMGGYGGFGQGGFGGGYGNSFGGYGGYQQKSSFLSGNKFGLILAGLAVWNLARSGQSTKHYHYYNNDNTGQMDPNGKMQPEAPVIDPVLGELSNCTLTITNGNNTDVIAIPCIMATSFAPNAKPGDPSATRIESSDSSSPLNCTITVITKSGSEIRTAIPCEELSKLAPKEPIPAVTPPPDGGIGLNCTANGDPGSNPCVPYTDAPINPGVPLEVIPLSSPSTTTIAEFMAESTSTTASPESTSTTVTSESTSTTTTTTTVAPTEMSAQETTLKPSE